MQISSFPGVTDVIEAAYGTPLYRKALDFRYEHLRRPLGLVWSEEDLCGEDAQFHFIVRRGDLFLGCVVFKPLDTGHVLLRQMAVAPECRGQGIGEALVRDCLERMKERGYAQVVSHVRETARGFYAKLGFVPQGEIFIQATLPTIRMTRML